jgi:hypothetical protein
MYCTIGDKIAEDVKKSPCYVNRAWVYKQGKTTRSRSTGDNSGAPIATNPERQALRCCLQ